MKKNERRKITPDAIRARKITGEPITLLTAYDYPLARAADLAEIDIVFASDAFGMVGLGRPGTTSVTVSEVIHHTRAVSAGAGSCLVLASMPFLSHATPEAALDNAGRLIREAGADAVEIEGGSEIAPIVRFLVQSGIAVVAHIGLTKQVIARTGSHRVQGKDAWRAAEILTDAMELEAAGAFSLILECVPDRLARAVTQAVSIPTIGIGAGVHCNGQGLVSQDMLGLYDQFCPRFVKKYAALLDASAEAFRAFRRDVTDKAFPEAAHSTVVDDAWEAAFRAATAGEACAQPAIPETKPTERETPRRRRTST